MPVSFNSITTFPLDLEACTGILLSALRLQENSCNEETPSSVFLVCSPSLLIINYRNIFFYFLSQTNKWIGFFLFSQLLNSLHHLQPCGYFSFCWKPLINRPETKFTSTLSSCTFFDLQSRNQWRVSRLGLSYVFLKIGKKCPNFEEKRWDCIHLWVEFLI